MHPFEFAAPATEEEAVALLEPRGRQKTEVLAGGVDLVPLLEKSVLRPERVVSIGGIASLKTISQDEAGVISIGAAVTLDQLLGSDATAAFPAIRHAIAGINSAVLQAQGTIGGEVCRRPSCWYFRTGYGLTADRGRMVAQGDNRYHAILGNGGPAKFVHASRIAPALIAIGATFRLLGTDGERFVTAGDFFRSPRSDEERENVLAPGELLTRIYLPKGPVSNATYEVRQSAGPDMPLAAAAAALSLKAGVVTSARIVLGQVAPIPWLSPEAAAAIVGRPVSESNAEQAGAAAVARATPLSENAYKVQLAKTAVKRAILLAAQPARRFD